jgi:serine/threonine-protein kinase
MQPRASPPGAERDAELDVDVPYRAPAPLASARTILAAAGWRLLERIGAGGSSQVWHALDPRGRNVALKIPRAAPRPEDEFAPLAREHELLASLRHRHIVATRGLVECGGVGALALEYLPGGDLVSLAGAHPRHWLPAARGLHTALVHLHARGLAHRDVKARNVLFDARGRARLIDFASARPLGAPVPSGGTTSAHRPAALTATVTTADDTYGFAVLLYELLAGRLPYGQAGRAAARARSSAAGAPTWPLAGRPRTGPVATLAALVLEVLDADGRGGPGLPAFTDALKSAAAEADWPPESTTR